MKKTEKQKKEEKRLYDIEYRKKNKKLIAEKKKRYAKSDAGRAMQKRQREKKKKSGYFNSYNAKPEQREKERFRRYVRLYGKDWRKKTKKCLVCDEIKIFLDFEHSPIFPDKRSYLCKDCEKFQNENYGCTTKNTITAMIMRPYTNLDRYDIAKHPYLIEANKFLILLKNQLL